MVTGIRIWAVTLAGLGLISPVLHIFGIESPFLYIVSFFCYDGLEPFTASQYINKVSQQMETLIMVDMRFFYKIMV